MRDPGHDLPLLRQKLDELNELASSGGDKALPLNDPFSRLTLFFFAKQHEHATGVLQLCACGLYRDAGLIARSMMEGLTQLLWASQDKARAVRWEEFSAVSGWRKMHKDEQSGHPADLKQRERIEVLLRQYGPLFYTKEARKKIAAGKKPSNDPYWRIWTGHRTHAEIFSEVRGNVWRLATYSPLSAWQHWDPEGFSDAIEREPGTGEMNYRAPSLRAGAEAVAVAFECLLQTFEIFDGHFELGHGPRIKALRRDYLAAFGPATE